MLARWIHDRPIAVKNALAPAVVLIVLALTVAGALLILDRQQGAIGAIRAAAEQQLDVSELSADLARVHAGLYRMTAQGTNAISVIDGSAFDMNAILDEMAAALADLRVRADALIAAAPSAAGDPAISELPALLEAYEKTANRVADMASLGSAQALRLILEADSLLAEVAPRLAALETVISQRAERTWSESAAHADAARVNFQLAAGVALIAGGLLAWAISRTIARRIVALASGIERLSHGGLDVAFSDRIHGDEIGRIEQAAQIFRAKLVENAAMEAREREAQARFADRQDDREQLVQRFDSAVGALIGRVSTAVGDLHAASDAMLANARETAGRSTSVAQSVDEASASNQAVSAATAQLAGTIREISGRMTETTSASDAAVDHARNAEDRVARLAAAADRIGEVVGIISGIAAQTNLLALNATIEAARAGEAGKGFAVVASEVKGLANQTARATEEISVQIAGVQAEVTAAVEAIRTINGAVREISGMAAAVARAIEEQGSATEVIARNVEQSADGAEEISRTIAGVSNIAGDTGRCATEVFEAAESLRTENEVLRGEVERFLEAVRTA